MKANELMISDWVAQKHGGLLLKVSEVRPPYIIADCEDGQFHEDTLEPIQLTPEILEKNGFHEEWDEDIKLMVYDTIRVEIGNNYKLYKDGKMYLHRVLAPLYYVHELQHALRLCGIDKEIVL